MPNQKTYYSILQVSPDADPEVIEAAYKALMKKHHPDRHAGGPAAADRAAAELNQAFGVLRDAGRRASYDAEEKARLARQRGLIERPPAAPAPHKRAANRVAASVGVLGLLALAAAIFVFAREPALVRTSPPTEAEVAAMAAATPEREQFVAASEAAFRDLPVSRQQVTRAAAEFRRVVSRNAGMAAAADFSRACFEAQRRTLGIGDLDFCIAFDHAASRTDLIPAQTRPEPVPYFLAPAAADRHVGAAGSLSSDATLVEARLFEIRRLTDAVLVEASAPISSDAASAGAASEPARRIVREPRRVRPTRTARSPPRPPEDFIEREGGIY